MWFFKHYFTDLNNPLLHRRLNWLLVAGYWHNKWFWELNSLSLSSALPANLQRPHLLAAMIVIQLACPLTGEIFKAKPGWWPNCKQLLSLSTWLLSSLQVNWWFHFRDVGSVCHPNWRKSAVNLRQVMRSCLALEEQKEKRSSHQSL